MSENDELDRAKKKLEEKMREHLARRITKISEEDFFPSGIKTCVRALKFVCALAVFICGPIMGWLYTEMVRETIAINLFIVYLFPMVFLAIIAAIVMIMKTPTE